MRSRVGEQLTGGNELGHPGPKVWVLMEEGLCRWPLSLGWAGRGPVHTGPCSPGAEVDMLATP